MNHRSPYLLPTLSFLAGGVLGAGVSLLLAPRSGKATRQLINVKLADGADSVRALRDKVVTSGQAGWDEASERLDEAAEALSGQHPRKANHKGDVASS